MSQPCFRLRRIEFPEIGHQKSPKDKRMQPFPLILESIEDLSGGQVQDVFKLAKLFKNGSKPAGLPVSSKGTKGEAVKGQALYNSKTPLIATFFQEPSTRTKNSFAIAAKRLKADYVDLDPQFSSLKKGEDLEQTFLTLKYQGVDLLIVRSPLEKISSQVKIPKVAYINGGDGKNEHPTQALLDVFSMTEKGLDIGQTTVALIGDILHSRVAHSLIKLIPSLGGKVLLCGPSDWLPKSGFGPSVQSVTSLEEAILKADVLYPLRIQKERHQNTAQNEDYFISNFKVSLKKLKEMQKEPLVYHAGPFNIGVEIDRDLLDSPLFQAYNQIENSIYIRMSIIQLMLEGFRNS